MEDELKAVWAKYQPQRDAEREILRTRREANEDLMALNTRRAAAGLPMVSEFQSLSTMQASQITWSPPQKTWRDDMEGELMAIIRRHCE